MALKNLHNAMKLNQIPKILQQEAEDIGFRVNANKTEYTCFKR